MKHNFIYLSLSLLSILLGSGTAHSEDIFYHQKVSLYNVLPVYETDIVMLGNSITAGGEFAELFNNPNIKNRGISGDVVDGIRKRLHSVTDGHPAKIFLLVGINDISHNLSPAQIAGKYDLLINEILTASPSSRIYIQSVMPVDNSFKRYKNLLGKEHNIPLLNIELKKIADKYNCTYIDLWPAMADKKGSLKKDFTNDGLHLTGEGYRAWTNLLKPYITESVEK